MDPIDSAATAKARADADLARAEREAAALLAELQAKDAANATAASVHQLPAPYAPGERPPDPTPDPVKGVAQPQGMQEQLMNAMDGNFKPVNLDDMRQPTNTSSHMVDFAQKIRDANKFGKK